jgi:hypothetical protein
MTTAANSFTRRRFLETTIVGSIPVVFSGTGNLTPLAADQGSCLSRLPNWNQDQLSNAVLNHVGGELARVYNAIESRRSATASEVRAVSTNLRLLAGHLDEIRLTHAVDQQIRGCRQEILDFVPSDEHLRTVSEHLTALGVPLSSRRLREMWSLPYEKKLKSISQLERRGIRGLTNQAVTWLNELASQLEPRGSSTNAVTSVRIALVRNQNFEQCEALLEASEDYAILGAAFVLAGAIAPPLVILGGIFVATAAVLALIHAIAC